MAKDMTVTAKKIFFGIIMWMYLKQRSFKNVQKVCLQMFSWCSLQNSPYGRITVQKMESVGLVKNTIGARLRKLCKNKAGEKIFDGKRVRAQGR